MKICPNCQHHNREGIFYCEECAQVLTHVPSVATKALNLSTSKLEGKNAWGTARFGTSSSILLQVREVPDPINILPRDETTVGRWDGTSPTPPSVDLTPFGAYEKGVSRMHAAIRRGEDTLMLVDLGSVNGTYLNGQRLQPNQARVLRDGDEIRLGKMVCHIYFK